ncbi:MAG: hypothetical protein LBC37_01540 [Zoogloeaceae bacterium]|jgi:hypothetical protein|nr:hypothetical protein [Zoogloeaceae bacterium]
MTVYPVGEVRAALSYLSGMQGRFAGDSMPRDEFLPDDDAIPATAFVEACRSQSSGIPASAIQSGGKSCQAKCKREIHAPTVKLVKSEGVSAVAIHAAVQLPETSEQPGKPSGLPLACGPRNDEAGEIERKSHQKECRKATPRQGK